MSRVFSNSVFELMQQLRESKIFFQLQNNRDEAITIAATVPGERWEIDIDHAGEVTLEVFRSNGELLDVTQLIQRIEQYAD